MADPKLTKEEELELEELLKELQKTNSKVGKSVDKGLESLQVTRAILESAGLTKKDLH